jgi:hypothetical protein
MTHSDPGIQTPSNDNLERTKRAQLEQSARNGSRYFFWIAFFSIFNQVMDLLSAKRRFVFGLGAPQYIERSLAAPNPTLIWGIIIVLAGIFVLFGIFARRGNIPVYIVGIVFYLADLVLSILSGDLVGAVVHVVFTVLLVLGLIATYKLRDNPAV